jgi:hypothetical protein
VKWNGGKVGGRTSGYVVTLGSGSGGPGNGGGPAASAVRPNTPANSTGLSSTATTVRRKSDQRFTAAACAAAAGRS